ATESSRWRYTPDGIRVLEYRSLKPGGDADDNEHLVFDWQHHRVKNVSPLDPWSMELPAGTLDKMVMQLAMLFDLRNGKKVFEYRVPRQDRIKTYHWALVGEDVTELDDLGSFRTLKLMRTDDRKDQSLVWSAPDLNYFPVHFQKKKKSGLKIDLILRKLEFIDPESQTADPAARSSGKDNDQDRISHGNTRKNTENYQGDHSAR
ncbi:MAG TPA: DUF3108 domain-containing protein, partial [Gammaproteobacteria bacterium]|nr:DUF3108 domain-containing protein [Gammaproteobacteria bacterium]